MSHDVDDGTETADPLVVAVHPVSPVVVVLGANLNGSGGSYVTNYVIAGQIDSIDAKDKKSIYINFKFDNKQADLFSCCYI